jgi:hypothetical protein
MNEQLKQLYKQAGMWANTQMPFTNPEWLEMRDSKFAELIIRECANRASWAQDTNAKDIGGEVLEHFGVEE